MKQRSYYEGVDFKILNNRKSVEEIHLCQELHKDYFI